MFWKLKTFQKAWFLHDNLAFDSHVTAENINSGINNVSNHNMPCDMDNILDCLFSLEKIVKMPKNVAVLRIVAAHENIKSK